MSPLMLAVMLLPFAAGADVRCSSGSGPDETCTPDRAVDVSALLQKDVGVQRQLPATMVVPGVQQAAPQYGTPAMPQVVPQVVQAAPQYGTPAMPQVVPQVVQAAPQYETPAMPQVVPQVVQAAPQYETPATGHRWRQVPLQYVPQAMPQAVPQATPQAVPQVMPPAAPLYVPQFMPPAAPQYIPQYAPPQETPPCAATCPQEAQLTCELFAIYTDVGGCAENCTAAMKSDMAVRLGCSGPYSATTTGMWVPADAPTDAGEAPPGFEGA